MKRLILAVVVLFIASIGFTATADACDMHDAKKAGEKHEHKKATAEGHACAMTEGEGHAHAACPMKDKKVASTSDVEMTGKLLCMKCNLGKEEKCRKVFQSADNAEKLYNLCLGSDVDLEKLAEEGAATVKIKGKLVKAEDGTEMLKIESGEKVAAPAA